MKNALVYEKSLDIWISIYFGRNIKFIFLISEKEAK